MSFFSVLLAATLALAGLASGAGLAKHPERIRKVSRSDRGATQLARAIFEGNGRRFVRAKFVTTPPGHNPVAVSTKRISGFPRRGGSFAILSTGCAGIVKTNNLTGAAGCADGGARVRGARDVTVWRIRLRVPRGANCLSFRFKFLSEEFPEWVGTEYNDAFIAEVGHSPTWTASDNRVPVIEAPDDFATTRDGNMISVNATQNARVTRAAARGTTYDAATGKLRASTRVSPGAQLLYLSLFDQGDRQFDSAVFIDRLTVRRAGKCVSGVVRTK
ncbi:MAG TPA: choice-of-anchor L domain-containing protein [Solirubrobacterales bacterium]|nr:choice-of-anchor L domain-containing protein [Solirubrobacterales bacterium]